MDYVESDTRENRKMTNKNKLENPNTSWKWFY
jgi:hypothetical protein